MNVTLISYTPDALNLLLRTKGTRLSHDDDPANWTETMKQEHIEYMRDTIRSSWEFVDYVFKIEGVTRVFTHQLVRTRTGSYAQQAMRVVDARDFDMDVPESVKERPFAFDQWLFSQETAFGVYGALLDEGVPAQDARGILPQNVLTNIIAKFNLRTLSQMAELRLCTRTQGEYQNVFREMRRLVLEAHPWAEDFIQVHCVARGTCAFPRYGAKECPIYNHGVGDNETLIGLNQAAIEEAWQTIRFEAAPMAKDGKAM